MVQKIGIRAIDKEDLNPMLERYYKLYYALFDARVKPGSFWTPKIDSTLTAQIIEKHSFPIEVVGYCARLEPGDVQINSNGSVILPDYNNKHLRLLHENAIRWVNRKLGRKPITEIEIVKMFTKYIHATIKNDDWYMRENHHAVPLENAIKRRSGVCKEQALILYMLLRREGIDTYVCELGPTAKRLKNGLEGHIQVKVKSSGKNYIADPLENLVLTEKMMRKHNKSQFVPRDTNIIRLKRAFLE